VRLIILERRKERFAREEQNNPFLSVGVEGRRHGADCRNFAAGTPFKLKGLRFANLFKWLSNSPQQVSKSTRRAVPYRISGTDMAGAGLKDLMWTVVPA